MHITARAKDTSSFIVGCTCGWIGTRRSTLQAAITDELAHIRESQPDPRPTPCGQDGCPIC